MSVLSGFEMAKQGCDEWFWAAVLAVISGCAEPAGRSDAEGSIAESVQWLAFIDGPDPGEHAHDEEPRTVRLSDFGGDERPGTELLVIALAAGWCAPCKAEASGLTAFARELEPRGATVLTAVFENSESEPADVEFVRLWAETFGLSIPTLVDSDFAFRESVPPGALPATLLLGARTFDIRGVTIGAESGKDPLRRQRELVNRHLDASSGP